MSLSKTYIADASIRKYINAFRLIFDPFIFNNHAYGERVVNISLEIFTGSFETCEPEGMVCVCVGRIILKKMGGLIAHDEHVTC